MKITKTTSVTYDVTFFPSGWDILQADFLNIRREHGMSTNNYERCFCCGKKLPLDEVPTFVQVNNGIGNRFACKECAEKDMNNV